MKVICKFGGFDLFVQAAPSVEPSHQVIGVYPATEGALCLLSALTGADTFTTLEIDGQKCLVAPHDQQADNRLLYLVDVIVAIRRASPDMVQLTIEGFDNG